MSADEQADDDRSDNGGTAAGRSARQRADARDQIVAELDARTRRAQTATIARLDELGGRVERLRAELADAADVLYQAAPRLDDTIAGLADAHARLDALTAQLGAGQPGAAVDWPALTAQQAGPVWDALADWIEIVLVPYYGITRARLPDCWPLHTPIVLRLIWLHATHQQAHAPAARAAQAAEWDTRWRPAALALIEAATKDRRCTPGDHHPDPAAPPLRFTAPPPAPTGARDPDGQPVIGHGHSDAPADRRFWQPNLDTARAHDLTARQTRRAPAGHLQT